MSADINTVVFCLYFFLLLTALALSLAEYILLTYKNTAYVNTLASTWSNGPIFSLNSATDSSCNNGESYLIKDKWPGTVDGCYSSGIMWIGECSKWKSMKKTGTTYPAISPIEYITWKLKKLCGSRMGGSYLDLVIEKNAEECPLGTRSCGVIDTFNNVLCVEHNKPCPLNYIRFIPSGESDPDGVKITHHVKLIDGKLIASNEMTSGRIVTEFRVSHSFPCANPNYIPANEDIYKLDVFYGRNKCEEPLGGELFDFNYTLLDAYNKCDLYNENGILENLNFLPDYICDNSIKLRIYTRHYIGISAKCMKHIQTNTLSSKIMSQLSQFEITLKDNLSVWIFILNSLSFGFTLFIIFGSYCILNHIFPPKLREIRFFGMLITCLQIVSLVFCCVHIVNINSLQKDYMTLNDSSCVDARSIDAFMSNISLVNQASNLSIVILIDVVFSVLLWLFLISYKYCHCHKNIIQNTETFEKQFTDDFPKDADQLHLTDSKEKDSNDTQPKAEETIKKDDE